MTNIRILIVDDHPVVLLGMGALISSGKGLELVGQARSGEEAVAQHAAIRPDITLMDLRLPGMGGVEAIRQIRRQCPDARFIVLTTYEGDEDIYQALEAGAAGYVIKDMPQQVLFDAIRKVRSGGRYLPNPISKALASRVPNSALSKRESDVLKLIAQGRSNGEIAGELGITEGTVKCHVSVILNRLNARDRTQAVVTALQRGLLHL
ncbi:MAG: response regulator transcription factor [Terracidiphilus sp.]|nr:response regulator transcription factor [Terracidiphilus sp.]